MKNLLIAPHGVDLAALAGALEGAGIDAVPIALPEIDQAPTQAIDRALLVQPPQGPLVVGAETVRVRQRLGPGVPLWVCCAQLKPSDRQRVVKCGATALMTPAGWSPHSIAERLLAELIDAGEVEPSAFGTLRGATVRMRQLYRDIQTVAALSDPVLILGETGTGKELVAREVHRSSKRPGSLMAINCAALTPELLESELFGHERGAFSGAVTSRKGLLAEAGDGTVFLDEIGDLAPSAQAKLLRVLEERKVRPVGSNHWHPVHARVVLATHRDLETAARDGAFRQDLFERIRGFTLYLPPLRERRADLVLLSRHFIEEYNREHDKRLTVPGGTLDPLFRHDWPGNIRELRQTLRRAAAFAGSDTGAISVLTLLDTVQRRRPVSDAFKVPFNPADDTWRAVHDRARALYFRAVLQQTGGNKEAAARRAGISRSQLYEVLKQIEESEAESPEG